MINQNKLLAQKMRMKGFTLSEISKELNIAKSSASSWTKDVILTKKSKERISLKRRLGNIKASETNSKNALERVRKSAAWSKFMVNSHKITNYDYQLICSILYWGEGAKFSNRVEFTNSDPVMLQLFLKSLVCGFGIDKSDVKLNLHLHSYHIESKQINFWCEKLGVDKDQFNKTFWKKNSDKIRRIDYPGCIRICYYSKEIVDKIKSFYKEVAFQILGP